MAPSKPEFQMIALLKKANIDFEREKTFSDLRKGLYRFDFYCPNVNGEEILIEVDGAYHREPIRGNQKLRKQKEHDRRKNSFCLAKELKLYRVPDFDLRDMESIEDLFSNDKYLVKSIWHSD